MGVAQVLGVKTSGPPPVPWSTKFMVFGSDMEFLFVTALNALLLNSFIAAI
jgi:hypothetical protein